MHRIARALFCLLLASAPVSAAESPTPLPQAPPLGEDGKQALAPLFEAYAQIDRELDALPPAQTDTERLMRLKRRNEVGRNVFRQIDFVSLPLPEGRAAVQAAQLEIERQDIQDQSALKALLPPRGWFLKSEISPEAMAVAWQIVRHAINSDIAFVRAVLATTKDMFDTGEIDKAEFAMLTDRVAVVDGVRQIYGTQMICNNFTWILYPVEDEANVDKRREDVGLGLTLADQLAQFATRKCPIAQYAGPIPR